MACSDTVSAKCDYPHPFVHAVKLSRAQKIRGVVLGCVLFPLRMALAAVFFLLMWPLARLRLAGLSPEERSRPVTGWRRWLLHPVVRLFSRAVFASLGFFWVKVKGRRADLKEAPVLVVAPHSGFLDMLVLCPAELATVVSRVENTSIPIIGALLEFNQAVIVSRKDPESRKKAVAHISERLTSNGYWPQMLMFPEGTTTNGRALIKFKPGDGGDAPPRRTCSLTRLADTSAGRFVLLSGMDVKDLSSSRFNSLGDQSLQAHGHVVFVVVVVVVVVFKALFSTFSPGAFLAGVPVQPVLLHYPNKLDTVRWTYKGTTWLENLWHTASQFYTNMTVEFLPVYKPSDEEKNNPTLYADNVQKLMAAALGVPATDYVMEGRVPVSKLGGLSLPLDSPAKETLSLLHSNGLGKSEVEAALGRMIDRCRSGAQGSVRANAEELIPLLGLTDRESAVKICGLYSKDDCVDLRQIYLSVAALSASVCFESLLHSAFDLFDEQGEGSLGAGELSGLMGALLGVPQRDVAELHARASKDGRLTEGDLLRVLTTHPIYRRSLTEYMESGKVGLQLANRKTVNGNNNLPKDGVCLRDCKKYE